MIYSYKYVNCCIVSSYSYDISETKPTAVGAQSSLHNKQKCELCFHGKCCSSDAGGLPLNTPSRSQRSASTEPFFIMAGLTRIFCLFCVPVHHLCAALPVLLSVPVGQNATISCNLTSRSEVTWYLLRADQLLPLLTHRRSHMNTHTVDGPAAPMSRFSVQGDLDSGPVRLHVLNVEQDDAGLYFCTGRCSGAVCVSRGIHLRVTGADRESAGGTPRRPCWSPWICVLPAFVSLSFFFLAGFYLCTGKQVVCCCTSERRESASRETEDVSLHYSSLKHADKPRPSILRRQDHVMYSAVTTRKKPDGSADSSVEVTPASISSHD